MPVTLTAPGVYIEEIPSGVRTITGVATSITAFVGRTKRGPTNEPMPIFSFGDFERLFGGLDVGYPLSYAVKDFFLNGGGQALIVRLYKDDGGNSFAKIVKDNITFQAISEGSWGNTLRLRIEASKLTDDDAKLIGADLHASELFNLYVHDTATQQSESFLNLTVKESSRRVDRVLKDQSGMLHISGNLPAAVPAAHADKPLDQWWKDDTASSKVEEAAKADDGGLLDVASFTGEGMQQKQTGLYALDKADLFNILCIPPEERDGDAQVKLSDALKYCVDRRAMLIVDPPQAWNAVDKIMDGTQKKLTDLTLAGPDARNAALFYPRVWQADIMRSGQLDVFVPCGIIAGIMARTDAQRGVWKAPAGIDATLSGVVDLEVKLNDGQNGILNQLGINCLRSFPVYGRVAWGARTLRGADQAADEYKYPGAAHGAIYRRKPVPGAEMGGV